MQFPRYERAAWIDAARLAAQSAAAAALTYAAMRMFGLEHLTWAVISALLVGQHSVDGTLVAVRGRLGGTVLGAAVGLAAIALLPGESLALARLVLAAAAVNAVAALEPRLRYGVVVAAIVTLEPGADPFEGALERALAIGIGAGAGAACAWLVWPQSARRRTLRELRRAIDDCAALLRGSVDRVLGKPVDIEPLHRRFLTHVGAARAQAAPMRRRGEADCLLQAVHAAERLWHALIVLDRISHSEEHAPPPNGALARALDEVREQSCAALGRLGSADTRATGRQADATHAVHAAIEEARAACCRAEDALGREAAVLDFALREIRRNLAELRDAFGSVPGAAAA